jgi:hypothetical protein
MPADHLVADGLDYIGNVEGAEFLRNSRMVDDLQLQVAEFVLQIQKIAPLDRVGDFIGFLDRIGGDRLERLLLVPAAAGLRIAQRRMISTRSARERREGASGSGISKCDNIHYVK